MGRARDYVRCCREELLVLMHCWCAIAVFWERCVSVCKRIHDIAMGSSLGPVLVNLCMGMFESELPPSILLSDTIWFRYVDDIFSFYVANEPSGFR